MNQPVCGLSNRSLTHHSRSLPIICSIGALASIMGSGVGEGGGSGVQDSRSSQQSKHSCGLHMMPLLKMSYCKAQCTEKGSLVAEVLSHEWSEL